MVFMYESIINLVDTSFSYTWDPTLPQVDAKGKLELAWNFIRLI